MGVNPIPKKQGIQLKAMYRRSNNTAVVLNRFNGIDVLIVTWIKVSSILKSLDVYLTFVESTSEESLTQSRWAYAWEGCT